MGSKMAPQYANLFIAQLEENFLASCNIRPLTYLQYIDDILIIWTASEKELLAFHQRFNQFHPTINLTLNHSYSVSWIQPSTSKMEPYKHPYTKNQQAVRHFMWDSFHHIKKSFVFNQALRYNQIYSNLDDRNKHLHSLRKTFVNQGYHPQVIDDQIHRTEINRVPIVVTYNPQLNIIRKIARNLQPMLHTDTRLKEIFPELPLLSYRQPPNLRKMIVRSALTETTKAGTFPCNSNRRETCKYILCKDQVAILNTQKVYTILDYYSCASSNVLYMITCTRCSTGGTYITNIKSTPNHVIHQWGNTSAVKITVFRTCRS
ncbi:hypothetical protein XELAEV_18014865mg [Xenopus laevis]|uniref:Reverse transcriptase domain-containing protein n=1 Tax=Xenopus laevis TaxID=8355 RepID=A0A974DGX3_XENLA|nr:hypothetical protein XELAEV_18014865mg [Xenopus laevis]